MFKKFFLSFFLILILFVLIYPSQKESTKLFNYCYSLEKMLSRNALKKRENVSKGVKSITKEILKFGVNNSQGGSIISAIVQYKQSKNLFIITLIPNQFYCLIGFWIEEVNPGVFESIFLTKSKQRINELKDKKGELDLFLKDIKSEYNNLKKDFNTLFNK